MSVLSGKKILLGITGGIAAYKTPLIIRLLKSVKAEVRVVMTPAAKDFVTPLTLSTLSGNPVLSNFTESQKDNPVWNDHVEIGKWADLFILAPATSNTLSAMVNAKCNNLLIATYLSCKSKVYIAPAMDLDMYAHPANQSNLEKLKSCGNKILPVGEGFLASGLYGKGRMLEPEEIIQWVEKDILESLPLNGKKVLVTAGPTYEPIDPVRFIGNHSSGKMGFALAEQAVKLGAEVILITGPSSVTTTYKMQIINVVTSEEMFIRVKNIFNKIDFALAAAAVADFKPKEPNHLKIKKEINLSTIKLEPTQDILAWMGKNKSHQFILGFALETNDEIKNAISKLKSKNLDAIVMNSLKNSGAGFSGDTNKVSYITRDEIIIPFELKLKDQVAIDIFTEILKHV
jgi:phosphopantothenoylcysteine decarboxylase/phosphopantothenate--cysteine ligase